MGHRRPRHGGPGLTVESLTREAGSIGPDIFAARPACLGIIGHDLAPDTGFLHLCISPLGAAVAINPERNIGDNVLAAASQADGFSELVGIDDPRV